MFSRNAQSSRAVPVKKVIEQIRNNPVTPIHWGSNQAGMVAGEEIDTSVSFSALWQGQDAFEKDQLDAWEYTAGKVADLMGSWDNAGYHKQIVNRIGEAFTFVRGVITATEFDNFFHLRIHPAADPFIQELARCMYEAYKLSEPEVLYEGEWHTPYVEHFRASDGDAFLEYHHNGLAITSERAREVSAAGTAQVSFRKLDLSDETVDRVYSRLVDDETPHASCVEHQATPINYEPNPEGQGHWEANADKLHFVKGLSHLDREGNLWSGNFKSWIQNRKLIPNEVCLKYGEKNNV
jgi:hypothetical protein